MATRWGFALATLVSTLGACSLLTNLDGLTSGPSDAGFRDGGDAQPSGDGAPNDVTPSDMIAPDADAAAPPSADLVQVNSGRTFFNDVKAHNAIIVTVGISSSTVSLLPITDSLGNKYSTIIGPVDRMDNTTTTRRYIALALNIAAGPATLSVHFDGTITAPEIYIHEYSGLALSNAFDATSFAIGTAATTPDSVASGFATTHADHELIFGFATAASAAAGTGFTGRSNFNGDVTEDKVVSSAGSYEATATITAGTRWTMIMATFRLQ